MQELKHNVLESYQKACVNKTRNKPKKKKDTKSKKQTRRESKASYDICAIFQKEKSPYWSRRGNFGGEVL